MAKQSGTKPEPETVTALRDASARGQWVFLGDVLIFPYKLRQGERGYWHLLHWSARRRKLAVVTFAPQQIAVTPFEIPSDGPALFAPFEGEHCDLSLPGRLVTA